jgi:hypothetical protein
MKNHIPSFEGFINENLNESVDFEFKDDSGQGRPTMVLKMGSCSWSKIKHLFDDAGRPVSDEVKKIPSQNTAWDLYAQLYSSASGKPMYKIYGVAGDWTFGNAPTYYQQKHRGNKKAAKEVLTNFVNKYLK